MNNTLDERVPLFSLDRRKSEILRGFAILFVLLVHTWYYTYGGSAGVSLFIMLSGYGLDCSFEKNGLTGYWRKRFFKVWLPACLVGLFDVLALRAEGGFWVFLCTITGLDFGKHYDPSLWFISYIMLWYLLYWLMARISLLFKEKRTGTLVRIAGLSLCSVGFYWLKDLGIWNDTINTGLYIPFFPLGVALAALSRIKVRERVRRLIWLAFFFLSLGYSFRVYMATESVGLAIAITFAMCTILLGGVFTVRKDIWTGTKERWLASLVLIALALALVLLVRTQPSVFIVSLAPAMQILAPSQLVRLRGGLERVLLWFGKYSYPIYLFEWPIFLRRKGWFGGLGYQPLIDLCFILLTALFAWAFWEAYRQFEELAEDALDRRKAPRGDNETEKLT